MRSSAQLHPEQGLRLAALLRRRAQPQPGARLHRRPARLPAGPHLPARRAGGRLRGRRRDARAAAQHRADDRRPAGHAGSRNGAVRALRPATCCGRWSSWPRRTRTARRGADPPDLLRPLRAAAAAGRARPPPRPPSWRRTPLYDFLTQLAAFDSPVATFLDRGDPRAQELPDALPVAAGRRLASSIRLERPEPFRDLFPRPPVRLWGKLETTPEAARIALVHRPRPLQQQIPLEYAYAAWGELARPAAGETDDYRTVSRRHARAAARLPGAASGGDGAHRQRLPRQPRRRARRRFALPDLAQFEGWRRRWRRRWTSSSRSSGTATSPPGRRRGLAPPERRVLAGESLIVGVPRGGPGARRGGAEPRAPAALRATAPARSGQRRRQALARTEARDEMDAGRVCACGCGSPARAWTAVSTRRWH